MHERVFERDKQRRVLHIEYAAAAQFGPGIELAIG